MWHSKFIDDRTAVQTDKEVIQGLTCVVLGAQENLGFGLFCSKVHASTLYSASVRGKDEHYYFPDYKQSNGVLETIGYKAKSFQSMTHAQVFLLLPKRASPKKDKHIINARLFLQVV